MNSDLTFITNEKNENLLDRFKVLIKDTRLFDALVGYFYTSGFHSLYKSLEHTEKIRILIGISTNRQVYELLQEVGSPQQQTLQFSHAETKGQFEGFVTNEMEESEDNRNVEEGVLKFIEWLKNEKLEIRAYPSQNLHAKLYIMTFTEGDRDKGRVITGSSNFTAGGLIDNLEFNVELKNRADYEFALQEFNELWKDAVDVSKKYIETINSKTWLNNTITPYELYLKFLYEYFKDDLGRTDEVFYKYVPPDFKKYEYQEQAVLNAKKILEEYGGVFISDVVGLGKTYVSALLAGQLEGRNLVIAPPFLLEEKNPGSWRNIFRYFNVPATFCSVGKLDSILKQDLDLYRNVFIDEAHRFRTETNITYEALAQIARGKRVILVTATPYNNRPKDILSQLKLFQKARKSTIPNVPDLDRFFSGLENKLVGIDRQQDYERYIKIAGENAKEVREKVLKYLIVRRTRSEIVRYFAKDLKQQKLKFPDVDDPKPIFYQLSDEEDEIFDYTIKRIAQDFRYSRYTPMLYYEGDITQPEELAQRNMGKFMKILLVKRLESSFFAFKNTLNRFINSYEQFLAEFEKEKVYVSKKYANKIFELLENDDEEAIQRLIDEDKAKVYPAKDFRKDYKVDLESDLALLKEIHKRWTTVKRDPKLLTFLKDLSSEAILRHNKLIIFTESKETADYLFKKLEDNKFRNQTLLFTGSSSAFIREKAIENFDARARFPKDDYRILISTEVLSEGVNLDRSNVVINYDIPWNPTRLMQRVGRINRIDTKFDTIYTYNFFPTRQSNDQIKLKELAQAKIHAFISMLGTDARLLTEGEPIESHELFSRLISKKTITGEDEAEQSELKYLQVIKDLRESDPEFFEKIKRLPKKARTSRKHDSESNTLLTYFRKSKLQKFYLASDEKDSQELDFLFAANLLEVPANTKRERLLNDYYDMLEKNKKAFLLVTTQEDHEIILRGGRDSASQTLRIIKSLMNFKGFTEDQEEYLKTVIRQLEEGSLPKQTTKKALQELNAELKKGVNYLRLLAVLQKTIPEALLKEHISEGAAKTAGPREVILSEYLIGTK